MGFLFGGGPSFPEPAPLPAVPTREDPEVQRRKDELKVANRKRRGRAATILTGGQGDQSDPKLGAPTLSNEGSVPV